LESVENHEKAPNNFVKLNGGRSAFSISVLICVYNAEKYIHNCIEALLDQTIKDFEIVIVDDGSTDNTQKMIADFDDKRIRYFNNKKNAGVAECRNKCIKLSKGEYVFFTDGDCIVAKNWLEQGLRFLKGKDCIGVEGRTYYVAEDYKPTFSDRVVENKEPGQFMTCNIAYKRSVIERIGGFDTRYIMNSDRDLALRAKKFGKILFNPDMVVYHQKVTLGPKEFIHMGKNFRSRVLLYKKFGERKFCLWRIVHPQNLISIICPPLIFGKLIFGIIFGRYRSKEDFALFPFIYIRLVYERLNIWDMCIKERVFLI